MIEPNLLFFGLCSMVLNYFLCHLNQGFETELRVGPKHRDHVSNFGLKTGKLILISTLLYIKVLEEEYYRLRPQRSSVADYPKSETTKNRDI